MTAIILSSTRKHFLNTSPLSSVLKQITSARIDLRQYQPDSTNWEARAIATAKVVVPWLEEHARGLQLYVTGVLNAPVELRRLWQDIQPIQQIPEETRVAIDQQLEWDNVLRDTVSGDVVSKVVTKYLMDRYSAFRSNGRSDYPDVYLSSVDYSEIPQFQRIRKGTSGVYGAARKGAEQRPVRVPDGLEIKTCRGIVRVDCHHPHAGLHLALVFHEANRHFTVTDILVAFLQANDYRESGRNTTATTVKYSFNGERFVSLLKSH